MAELKPGAVGIISGKVDNVVGSNWRDIWVLKGTAKKHSTKYSQAQIAQRAKFNLIFDLFSQLSDVVKMGFGNLYTGRSTAFNLAFGRNINAVTGDYPALTIDYPSLVMSQGRLAPCADLTLESSLPYTVSITWGDERPVVNSGLSDKVTAVFCEPEKGIATFSTGEAVRGDYKVDIVLPKMFSAKNLHVYLFFTSPDGKKNSESVYAGMVTVF